MVDVCLITDGPNVGDAFIRKGVEAGLAPGASRTVWYKSSGTPIPMAGRYIVCGMPLIWSEGDNAHWKQPWWSVLMGLGSKLHCFGVGACCRLDGVVTDLRALRRTAHELHDSCAEIVARDRYFNRITGLQVGVAPCPAMRAFSGNKNRGGRRLANLMEHGGHWPEFGAEQAAAWREKLPRLAGVLRSYGFTAIAHDAAEAKLARFLGFSDVTEYIGDLDAFMATYREAGMWFGNRVHGAIAAIGAGARSWCVGIDSRLDAVAVAGGDISIPTQVNPGSLEEWITEG